jgi:CBS domain-containing protein
MTVRTILNDDKRGGIIAAEPGDTVAQVIAVLAQRRIGCVPIVDDGQVLGIFSERDVVYGLAREGSALLDRPIEAVMTAPAVTIDADTPILSALTLMTQRRIRHLPVIENGAMIGFVSIGDLVKSRMDRIESEAEAMRSYIQQA